VGISRGGHDDPGTEAADAILKAIKAGSAEQLDMALRDHYDACKDESPDEEGPDEEDHDEYGSDEGE
jgi:DNA-binding GntR family transcriptional regulator